ncbi:MANSC domain-containing protein 4 [Tiliqua scincoides]|uniref:MANSC domain-containing protein 4 n=1 Tax=Tiliqua scincoides TaxID=71010 RepID=UPI00346347CE
MSEVFLLLGWVWQSDCLCSPTTFYQNCWIRRFPRLAVDLEQSKERGAHLLKVYTEATAQQCSRTCCLMKNVSCNLAVFNYETSNCVHVYCPALESCIVRPRINVVLYNITPGIDPDLLIFEKLSFKDLSIRSSFHKWERHGSARVANAENCQDANTSSTCLPAETSPTTMTHELVDNSSAPSTASGFTDRIASISWGPTSAPLTVPPTRVMEVLSEEKGSTANPDNATASATSPLTSSTMLSHMPSPAHLNSSKQHLNETKGYSGRNHTSDDGAQRPVLGGVGRGEWLFPVVFCIAFILICCCATLVTTGCCRKRRGHYKPRQRRASASRTFPRYGMVRNNF